MRHICVLILFFLFFTTDAVETQERKDIAKLFHDENVVGTFVLYDLTESRFIIHNRARVSQRFIPASTYKTPNSLIGLSVGVVTQVDEVLPSGVKPESF